jgi:hypothetical protein
MEERDWGLDLNCYGSCLNLYKGNGIVSFDNGQTVACAFEAGQLVTGDVILLCASESTALFDFSESARAFVGTTIEGYELSANSRITEMNYLPDRPRGQAGNWAAFRLDKLSADLAKGGQIQSARFGITNFKFACTAVLIESNSYVHILPLKLDNQGRLIEVHIRPVERHEKVVQKVQTLKGTDVTCEVVVERCSIDEDAQIEQMIDNLCHILLYRTKNDVELWS